MEHAGWPGLKSDFEFVDKEDKEIMDESEIAMQNFTEALKTKETRKKYLYSLNTYLDFLEIKDKKTELSLLLKSDPKDIEKSVISYVLKQRKDGYAYSTINANVWGIISFFEINDIVLNKKENI